MQDWMKQAADAAAAASPTEMAPAPDVVPGRVIHVDGDLLCYWAGGNEDTTVQTSRFVALGKIEKMRELSGSESVVVHMSSAGCTKADRRIIATVKEYQGQRKSGRRPKNWQYLRDFFEGYEGTLFKVKNWHRREADDGIALCAYDGYFKTGKPIVIASGDKDMRMLPGLHIDWNTFELVDVPMDAYEVYNADRSKLYGFKWFWQQMLQGDTADNIPGLERYNGKAVGEKTAQALLAECQDNEAAFQKVMELYELHYCDEWADRFVEQAMLLWLRTDFDAWCGDFLKGLENPVLRRAVQAVEQRIKEAYAEAESLGSSSLQDSHAG